MVPSEASWEKPVPGLSPDSHGLLALPPVALVVETALSPPFPFMAFSGPHSGGRYCRQIRHCFLFCLVQVGTDQIGHGAGLWAVW